MAYAGCTTPLGCSSCSKYDVFSNPNVYQDGSPVGTSIQNNALSLNESRQSSVALQDSLQEGGLIFSAEPNRVALTMVCVEITVVGWNIGTGADITSVTVAGISTSDIREQSRHHVTFDLMISGATATTGDIVVNSAGFSTTLTDGFTFDTTSSLVVVEDFETKLDIFYQADESVGWYYFDTYCPTGTGDVCESYGPASGDGMFALVKVDGSGRDAVFESEFSSGDCVDTVSEISVNYYAYSTSSHCFSSNFLQLRVQYTAGGIWETVATTSAKHSSNSQTWKSLSTSGFNSVVYGVQVVARTYSSNNNCDYWNPVAVDDISVTFTSQCECVTVSPTISVAPSGVPSTSSPTPNITVSGEDDDGLLSSNLLIYAVIGVIFFIAIMACFCWCDKWHTRRKERKAARYAAQARENEMHSRY
jgi:hypothetical protein